MSFLGETTVKLSRKNLQKPSSYSNFSKSALLPLKNIKSTKKNITNVRHLKDPPLPDAVFKIWWRNLKK